MFLVAVLSMSWNRRRESNGRADRAIEFLFDYCTSTCIIHQNLYGQSNDAIVESTFGRLRVLLLDPSRTQSGTNIDRTER